jgi:hypothetical protein
MLRIVCSSWPLRHALLHFGVADGLVHETSLCAVLCFDVANRLLELALQRALLRVQLALQGAILRCRRALLGRFGAIEFLRQAPQLCFQLTILRRLRRTPRGRSLSLGQVEDHRFDR